MTAAPAMGAAPAATSAQASDVKLGKRLVTKYFAALQAKDTKALDAMLSPAFQVARADGSTARKAAYLANLPNVETYALSKFDVTRAGRELVARYSVVTSETIDGEVLTKDPALRLSVFVHNKKSDTWRLIAHSNFNTPVKTS